MDIDDLDPLIRTEIFPQLGDKDIHTSCGKIVVFAPDLGQRLGAGQNTVQTQAKQAQQRGFFRGELVFFLLTVVPIGKYPQGEIEMEVAESEFLNLRLGSSPSVHIRLRIA